MLVITDEAPSPDLATLATVKAGLGISGTDQDATLEPLITSASAAIQTYLNRVLVEEGVQETFRHSRSIMLARYPISELTTITSDGVTVDESAYELDLSTGILERLAGCWGRAVVVSYIAGFPLKTMPADVVQALVLLVQQQLSQASRDPLLRAEQTTDIESLQWQTAPSALPTAVTDLLQAHRKPAGA